MKKRLLSLALALALCLGLLPSAALAAEAELPDWQFLFAVFKNVDAGGKDQNGKSARAKYSMTQDELDFIREDAQDFQEYMNQVGVMQAHVDVVEIDAQVTDLDEYSGGSWLSDNQAAPLLEDTVDLDRYDHVFCVVSLNELDTKWLGLTGAPFENGTGQTCINLRNRDYCLNVLRSTEKEFPESMYVHEFLHFMNQLSVKWGKEYGLHDIRLNFYKPDDDNGEACYTDIILNRARGDAGTGVAPAAWRYPPRILRTTSELTVPSGVTSIGPYAFQNLANLTKVTIPGSVSEIGKYSFRNCTGLTEAIILSGVAGIGEWAFGCYGDLQGSLVKVFIPASVTSIEYAAFWKSGVKEVYYGGTEEQWKAIRMGEFNNALTSATIHFNSPEPQQPAGARYDHRCAASLTD